MKKVLIILLALALVFGLVLSSCDMFGGGGSSGGSRNPVIPGDKDPKPKKGAPNPVVDGANYLTISGRTANYFTVDIFTDNTFADYTADKDHTVTVYIKGPTSATQFFFGKGKSDYGSYGDSDSFDLVAGSGGVYKAVRKFTYAEISQKMNIRAVAADTISSITIYEITIADEAGKSIYKMSADTDIQDAKDGADPFKASKDAGNDPPFTTWLKISGSPTIAVAVPGEDEVDDDPPVTPPEPQKFTITSGKAVHDNFKIEKSTAGAHGAFSGTEGEDTDKDGNKTPNGIFSWKGGAIRYKYPVEAGVFDYKDYDFVEVKWEASGDIANVVYKQYDSGTDYNPLTGSPLAAGEGTFIYDLRYGNGGFAIQRHSTNTVDMTVEITKITFIKGIRYPISFDAALPGVTVPATAPKYVVDGQAIVGIASKVGPLPSLTASGWTHMGWKLGTTVVDKDTSVTSSFNYATLTAYWIYTPKQDPQKVTFSAGNLVGVAAGTSPPATRAATPTVANGGKGYTADVVDSGYGWAYVYFKYTFTNSAELSHFNKVTLKYTAEGGNVGDKKLGLVVKEASSFGSYVQFEDDSVVPLVNVTTGDTDKAITFELNQGSMTQFDGKALGFGISINSDSYKITISDVTFSQD